MLKSTLLVLGLLVSAAAFADDTTAAKDAAAKKEAARTEARARTCLRSTGTRIVLKNQQCVSAPGRVYSQEDLQRTGQVSPAQALRQLDPAF